MINLIIKRLKDTAAVTTITTADRIFPLIRLQGSNVPALVVQLVGGSPTEAKEETSQVDDNLVEVTAFAQEPAQAWALSSAVRDALDGYSQGYLADVRFQNHASDIFESTDIFSITARYLVRTRRDASATPAAMAGLGYSVDFRGPLNYKIKSITASPTPSTILSHDGTENTIFIDWSIGGGNGIHKVHLPKVAEVEGRALRIMTGSGISQQKRVQIHPDKNEASVTIDGAAYHQLDRPFDGVLLIEHAGSWYIAQRKSK